MVQRAIIKEDLGLIRRLNEMRQKREEEFEKVYRVAVNYQSARWTGVKGSFEHRTKQFDREIGRGNLVKGSLLAYEKQALAGASQRAEIESVKKGRARLGNPKGQGHNSTIWFLLQAE